ncbi:MAG: FG-GAP-like repeat-containing protein [Candidatus Eisenbacteria bacterium]
MGFTARTLELCRRRTDPGRPGGWRGGSVVRRVGLALLLVAAVGATSCSNRDEFVDGAIARARAQAQRRDFAAAHAILDSAIDKVPNDVALVLEKAAIHARAHEFDRAASWYSEALKVDGRSVEAVVGRWASLHEGAAGDTAMSAGIRLEADALLAEAPDSLFNLTAHVRAYYLLGVEDEATTAADRVMSLYPSSELGDELLKEEIDGISVERDDERRLEMADAFLAKHPVTDRLPRALELKLVSLRRLDRHDEVLAVGREWARARSYEPALLDVAAAALVASRRAPDEAAGLARRAIDLTLAGAPDDAPGETTDATDGAARGRRGHDRSDGGARTAAGDLPRYYLTLARALVLAEDFASAKEAVEAGLSRVDTGPDEEETGAAWFFTLGQALEGLRRGDDALDAYLEAMVAGGRQNRWPARADTALTALYASEFETRAGGASLLEFARERIEYAGPTFTDATEEAGLLDRGESRLAWGDYDGDGYDDLLLSGRVLMRNTGKGAFVDVTESAGIGGTGANGAVWADCDNDGDLDFYATSGATEGDLTDRLWRNDGDGTFTDVTASAGGVTDHYTTEGAAWGDFDGDGLVDLYLASYERPRTDTFEEYGVGFPDILYANRGGGTFENVTERLGLVPPFGRHLSGRGVNWGDYDNDGDLDIFVSNYRLQENLLWRNDGGRGFTNVAPELGVSGTEIDGWWGHTIGSEWGDIDNDGDLDLVCANLAHPRYIEVSDKSMLYRNTLGGGGFTGIEAFIERRADAGVKYAETHSDPSLGDVDNDGDLDLFITSIYPNCGSFLYLNDGMGDFTDATWLSGVRSFNGWGGAMSDYDHDGDLDIAVASGSGFRLFRNDTVTERGRAAGRHWLSVRCEGTRTNGSGIGARVTVRSGTRTWTREIQGGKGTTSQHSMTTHFGLGGRGGPVRVEVKFPGGETVTLEDVAVDRLITVVEPGSRER